MSAVKWRETSPVPTRTEIGVSQGLAHNEVGSVTLRVASQVLASQRSSFSVGSHLAPGRAKTQPNANVQIGQM